VRLTIDATARHYVKFNVIIAATAEYNGTLVDSLKLAVRQK